MTREEFIAEFTEAAPNIAWKYRDNLAYINEFSASGGHFMIAHNGRWWSAFYDRRVNLLSVYRHETARGALDELARQLNELIDGMREDLALLKITATEITATEITATDGD